VNTKLGRRRETIAATIMKDVTSHLSSYRECVRHLWNTHFLDVAAHSTDKWAVRDQFDDASQLLFAALVVEPLGMVAASQTRRVLSPSRDSVPQIHRWLHVVPKDTPIGVPIMINRDPQQSDGYWDHPIQRVLPADVDLRFVRWFDFDEFAFRGLRYYLVRVDSAARGDIVGRAALIECEYCIVLLDEAGFSDGSFVDR
jgi:hypothetical protein